MRVEVRLFATLRRYVPHLGVGEPLYVNVPEGATARDVLERLGVPPEEVKIIMRNNRQVDMDTRLEEGDRLAFIPAVGGG